jgi:hypothetical protein
MSRDDGVYILKTKGDEGYEYRVGSCTSIDNLEYGYRETNVFLPDDEKEWDEDFVLYVWGTSKVFKDHKSALVEAAAEEMRWTSKAHGGPEYGICDIDQFREKRFPNS